MLREGEPLKLKRGMRIVPLLSVDIPVEVQEVAAEQTQKTYMLKYVCPNGCTNKQGRVLTVRMTDANTEPGIRCGGCGTSMVAGVA